MNFIWEDVRGQLLASALLYLRCLNLLSVFILTMFKNVVILYRGMQNRGMQITVVKIRVVQI